MRKKRFVGAVLAAALLAGGGVATAAPAQAIPFTTQWTTMNSTKALCQNAVKWKLFELQQKGRKVVGQNACRLSSDGWEAAIRYQ